MFARWLLPGLCALLVFLPSMTAAADESDWAVGVAALKITPEKPVALAGYAARTKPFETVDQDLWAKALALADSAGNRAVLITFDICILPPDVATGVRVRIVERTKLNPASVVLSVSHTHSGPAVSLQDQPGGVNPGDPATVEYTRSLMEKLVAVAEKALSDLKPARLSWGSGIANFPMNRRQFTERGVVLGINPRGLVDRTVPILRIDGADGKLRAVLFGCACHGTTVSSKHLGVCGDYAGFAKAFIQEQNPGAEAMFMMGCGGDANPYPRHEEGIALAKQHGLELGKEVCRVLGTKLQPVRGPLKCVMETPELPLVALDRAAVEAMAKSGTGLNKLMGQQMLAMLDNGEKLPTAYRAPVSAWQFGQDLTLIALPGEVVVGYVHLVENAVGPLKLWVAAYCHEVAGYVPTQRVLKEGGYETRGLYIGVGLFTPAVEEVVVNAARQAAMKAGRVMPAAAP